MKSFLLAVGIFFGFIALRDIYINQPELFLIAAAVSAILIGASAAFPPERSGGGNI